MLTPVMYFLIGLVTGLLILMLLRNKFNRFQSRKKPGLESPNSGEITQLLNTLKAKGELQDKLLEHLPVGVLLLNNQFEILSGNQLGFSYLENLQPDFNRVKITRLGELEVDDLISRGADPLPLEFKLSGDQPAIIEVQLRKAQTIEGLYWILMIADVTEEREIQQRVQIQDRLATLGQFAAGIAHDFNNILSAIRIYLDVIAGDSDLSSGNLSRVNAVREQTQRAEDLIHRILDFSRDQPLEQQVFDFYPFLKEMIQLLESTLPDTIQIINNLPEDPVPLPILGDPVRLQQVFVNLALNSRDAMPAGGKLDILLEVVTVADHKRFSTPDLEPGDWFSIEVKDTGVGIAPQHQARIFEPFFTTKQDQGGTGLGLAQVYGILQQHGGVIELESIPGKGTTFRIFLPRSNQDILPEAQSSPVSRHQAEGELVLIVEDDQGLSDAMRDTYQDAGYQVVSARGGKRGLEIIQQEGVNICLVISDIMIPELDGIDMIQQARESFPDLRCIFITGHTDQISRIDLDGDSNTRLLVKPFTMQDLLSLSLDVLS